jgi:sec-independent protein translocase protein TatA
MFGLGYQELLVILVIVLILFGANRLPDLARSLGSSMKEFKKGIDESKRENGSTGSGTSNEETKAASVPMPPCRVCQSPLLTDWQHCPRCGTPVGQGSPPSRST